MENISKRKKKVTLTVTSDIKAKIDQMSESMGMPRTQCINMLVTQWLKENV